MTCNTYSPPVTLPTGTICRQLLIPDDFRIIAAVNDVLARLTLPDTWEGDIDTASLLTDMWDHYRNPCEESEPTMSPVPIGGIIPFAGSSIPDDWMLCNGGALSQSVYPELFAVIGNTYTFNAPTGYFNLPELVGRFPMGTNANNPLGAKGGAATVTLTESELPAHTHGIAARNAPYTGSGSVDRVARGLSSAGASTTVSQSAGGGQAHENMPPYTALNYIIRVR